MIMGTIARNLGWVPLPPGHTFTCDRTSHGYSKTASSDRCGRPAVWENRRECNCGQCDMTSRMCSECLVLDMMDECAEREMVIERAVTKIREFDPEIPSRNAALLKIMGIEQTSPDEPDEYYRDHHQQIRRG